MVAGVDSTGNLDCEKMFFKVEVYLFLKLLFH